MNTIHPTDQLSVVRTAALERQRRADEFRTLRSREVHGRTDVKRATLSVVTAGLLATLAFGALSPAAAEIRDDWQRLVDAEPDTYTGTDQRLVPGLPDGFWVPRDGSGPSHGAAGRVR